jgi:hypothetical protein
MPHPEDDAANADVEAWRVAEAIRAANQAAAAERWARATQVAADDGIPF